MMNAKLNEDAVAKDIVSPANLSDWHTLREVEMFLFREAELADTHRYAEWLKLWTKDLLYWVPCNADELDPKRKISLIYDDRDKLEERLYRLGTKHAHSQQPKSRLVRTVSNILLEDYDAARGGTVISRFVCGEARGEEQTVWMGRTRHTLVREEGRLMLKEKKVFLLNNDMRMGNLTFII
jgi:3-phenylpropionate/cinnamic acid dioxygenase small subunit